MLPHPPDVCHPMSHIFTQSGVAADRCAREIGPFLKSSRATRSRQLNGRAVGGSQPESRTESINPFDVGSGVRGVLVVDAQGAIEGDPVPCGLVTGGGKRMPANAMQCWCGLVSAFRSCPSVPFTMLPPTISLQRTRFAPKDRWHFDSWHRPECIPALAVRRS